MTALERIWVQWPQPKGTGLAFSCQARPPAFRQEYVRADFADAILSEVKAENAKLTEALEGISIAGGNAEWCRLTARAAIQEKDQ